MPKGSPGKRRGRRGPNASKQPKVTEATRREAAAAAVASMPKEELAERRMAQAAKIKSSSRMKNPVALEVAIDTLLTALEQRDYLRVKLHKDEMTSDESKVLYGLVGQKIPKLLQGLGVDDLREEGDCPDCDGDGEIDGVTCETCDGTGGV